MSDFDHTHDFTWAIRKMLEGWHVRRKPFARFTSLAYYRYPPPEGEATEAMERDGTPAIYLHDGRGIPLSQWLMFPHDYLASDYALSERTENRLPDALSARTEIEHD